MTAGATRFAEKQSFTRGSIAGNRRSPCATRRREASNVRDQLPDLIVRVRAKWRHLRTGHAFANRPEQVAIVRAARKRAGIERRSPVALSTSAVTRRARLLVGALSGGNRGWVA